MKNVKLILLALGIGIGFVVSPPFVEAVAASLVAAIIWNAIQTSRNHQDE